MSKEVYALKLDFSKILEKDKMKTKFGFYHRLYYSLRYGDKVDSGWVHGSYPLSLRSDQPAAIDLLLGQKGWDVNPQVGDSGIKGDKLLSCRFVDAGGKPIQGLEIKMQSFTRNYPDKTLIAEAVAKTDANGHGPSLPIKMKESLELSIRTWQGRDSLIWYDWSEYLLMWQNHTHLEITSGLVLHKEKLELVKYDDFFASVARDATIISLPAPKADFTPPPMVVTVGALAWAADFVYGDVQIKKLETWEGISFEDLVTTGHLKPTFLKDAKQEDYKADICYHKATDELLIANRGTVLKIPDHLANGAADVSLAVGGKPLIAYLAEDLALAAMEKYPSVKAIHLTGHSLGGALSQWQTLKLSDYLAKKHKEHIPVTNVSWNAPGIWGSSKRLGRYHSYNICTRGDIVHMFGGHDIKETMGISLNYAKPPSYFHMAMEMAVPSGALFLSAKEALDAHAMSLMDQAINSSALASLVIGKLHELKRQEILDKGHDMIVSVAYDKDGFNQFGYNDQDYQIFLKDQDHAFSGQTYIQRSGYKMALQQKLAELES